MPLPTSRPPHRSSPLCLGPAGAAAAQRTSVQGSSEHRSSFGGAAEAGPFPATATGTVLGGGPQGGASAGFGSTATPTTHTSAPTGGSATVAQPGAAMGSGSGAAGTTFTGQGRSGEEAMGGGGCWIPPPSTAASRVHEVFVTGQCK